MAKLYGFNQLTARELARMVYQLKHEAAELRRDSQRMQAALRAASAGQLHVEYVKCIETLQPGSSATCKLQVWDKDSEAYTDSTRYPRQEANDGTITHDLTVYDPRSWAFAVGTDDYSSTTHILPVAVSPFSGRMEVIAPTNLIQQAKPDSTITTGNTGTFSIYQDGTDTTVNVTANVTWGDNAEGVTSGKESWIRWNGSQWEWVGGDCE